MLLPPPHPQVEFDRQFRRPDRGQSWLGQASCPWRYTRFNDCYTVCGAYPKVLVVPRDITDEELLASAAFRSEQRLPALTWGSPHSAASIWRSSQPKVGVAGNVCPEDEKLLRLMGAGELGLKPLDGNGGAEGGVKVVSCMWGVGRMGWSGGSFEDERVIPCLVMIGRVAHPSSLGL